MKVREVMTSPVVRIHPDENAAVAARALTQYNIGVLPVCAGDGRLRGLVTDRDLVIRCVAAGQNPESTSVAQVMTKQVVSVPPDAEASQAAELMRAVQVRRLPVMENGRLCGMVSLGDIARGEEGALEAGNTLAQIASELSRRGKTV